MEANENTLFFLGFVIKRTEEDTIIISDTRYNGENSIVFKKIDERMILLPGEGITPSDLNEFCFMPTSVYIHIAEAADAFFDKLNEGRN